jgi:2-succinyl-6-hydroxy-2,4-cyclohexadiene-1-carboxylate synthase
VDIILLHGFSNTGACWRRVTERLPAGARTPDLRGHGARAGRRPVDLAAVLDDLAGGDAPPGRCVLGGYSQGGRIALHAALDPRLAGRLARLVLISASPGLADAAEREARRRADEVLAARFEPMTIEQIAAAWERTPVLAGLPPEIAAEARADRRRNTPAGLAAALRGLGTGALPPLWDRLPELAIPVTLIVGERDAKFRRIAQEMAGLLREPRVVVAEGAGPAVHLERPDLVAAELVVEAEQPVA